MKFLFFHSCTVHLDTIKVFYLPTDAQWSYFKRILKLIIKQLLHVSVQSPSSGSVLFDMIYLLTAIGLSPDGRSTVHIYTQTIHRTTQNKQYIEQHKNFGIVRAVPRLGELYPGICLTTEGKARKTLNQGSRTIRIHTPSNKNT
jgi:hypothetical protein